MGREVPGEVAGVFISSNAVLANFRLADHSKVGQISQYKGVNQEFCAVRIGAGGTTISASPVATS